MDYQGNYFPDEHDENESKIYKTVKRIFKWTMYGISFLIYGIIFYVLITNRDSSVLENNYFTDIPGYESIDEDDMILHRINTIIFMNDDGSLQVHNVDYSDEYGLLEIGIKFNAKKLTDGEYGDVLNFVLKDDKGKTYPLVNTVTDDSGRYGFYRICFSGLNIHLESNNLKYDPKTAQFPKVIESYTLEVSRKSDGRVIPVSVKDGTAVKAFTIYDNKTTFNSTDYND